MTESLARTRSQPEAAVKRMLQLPPLALYVHIPWCMRKCPYCDFNSHEVGSNLPEAEYLAALARDLARDRELAQGRRLVSLFFGGGTPSLFSAATVARIVELAERQIGLADDAEVTLEANPGTLEQQKFRDFRAAGVNRLSVGVQSFNNRHLRRLGRIHDRANAIRALELGRRAGFDNINLDLMHGLPDQTPAEALADLQLALSLGPEHLSWYQLTIEPNTVFYSSPPSLPADDTLAEIQEEGQSLLDESGYRQYEISAYASRDRYSRHNLNYWQFGDYLGIGAGAHAKVSFPERGEIWRLQKTRLPIHYLARERKFISARSRVQRQQLPLEFMMNALRLTGGVAAELYPLRTGLSLASLEPQRSRLINRGLLTEDPARLAATGLGLRFLNDLLAHFD